MLVKRLIGRLIRVGCYLIAALVLLELGLRLAGYLYAKKFYAGLDGGAGSPGAINILAVGESSTIGIWLKHVDRESYPKQLESLLRAHYGNDRINVIIPGPGIGWNTSQMANRFQTYYEIYRPRLVIFMVGANNWWSFSESHLGKFLVPEGGIKGRLKLMMVRTLMALDGLKVVKVIKHAYFAVTQRDDSFQFAPLKGRIDGVLGRPDVELWRPNSLVPSVLRNASLEEPERQLLRFDLGIMIDAAKDSHIMLMTYPVQAVPISQLGEIARECNIPLIRNDSSFEEAIGSQKELLDVYFFSDHWHPNAKGYSIIARNVFDYIRANDLMRLSKNAAPGCLTH